MINVFRKARRQLRTAAHRVKVGCTAAFDDFATPSYAQEGEDMVLRRIFDKQVSGFYIDVGAHHPCRHSNTYYFYRLGWRGINVDAMPGSMQPFHRIRPRDINLELGVSESEQTLQYHSFSEPLYNGFGITDAAKQAMASGYLRLLDTVQLKTEPLSKILSTHLPAGQQIDFLTVDVEGLDAEVLRSNDWTRFRPRFVLAEDLDVQSLDQQAESDAVKFLKGIGYRPVCKTPRTLVFQANG